MDGKEDENKGTYIQNNEKSGVKIWSDFMMPCKISKLKDLRNESFKDLTMILTTLGLGAWKGGPSVSRALRLTDGNKSVSKINKKRTKIHKREI